MRFLDRIAEAFSGHKAWNVAAMAMMREDAEKQVVQIRLIGYHGKPSRQHDEMLTAMGDTLRRIHQQCHGRSKKKTAGS